MMHPIDLAMIQSALKRVERAMELAKDDPDALRYFRVACDLTAAKHDLKAVLACNVQQDAA